MTQWIALLFLNAQPMNAGHELRAHMLITSDEPITEFIDRPTALAVAKLGVNWEIIDSRELAYLNLAEDSSILMVRNRYTELHNAPRVAEGYRFLPYDTTITIHDYLEFNNKYRCHLEGRLDERDRAWRIGEVLYETKRLYQVYDALRDSRSEYYYVTVRRRGLARLRNMLGDEAWEAGEMPPCVPVWRFQEVTR